MPTEVVAETDRRCVRQHFGRVIRDKHSEGARCWRVELEVDSLGSVISVAGV